MDEVELKRFNEPTDNNNVENGETIEVVAGNGTCPDHPRVPSNTEGRPLLSTAQGAGSNRDLCVVQCSYEPGQKPRVLQRLKQELNKPLVWKIRAWMAILIALVFLVLIILLICHLCSGQQEDADDQYDVSSFVVPLFFKGSFGFANQSIMQDSAPDSYDVLFKNLQQKLTDIYSSSHALGRYFSVATVKTPRNGSVQYELKFNVPVEHEQLSRYILSRQMVYNVLLQHLHDQSLTDPLYIEPASLEMEVGQ
ncbi:hypothetical protein NFI96_024958 [Prochilodus magdalenae]|nr:hypothetical protein NFI96_024958 [Prochilodus magdalenae]